MASRIHTEPLHTLSKGLGEPRIPFEFTPPATDYETDHLEYVDTEGGERITWPLIGKSLFRPEGDPTLEDIARANPGQLTFHGLGGFSLGDHHEFFMTNTVVQRAYRFGPVEVSFGEGSPLLAMLFWGYYYEKYFGPWDSSVFLRVSGCPRTDVERYVIAACLEYEREVGVLPAVMQLDLALQFAEDEFETGGSGVTLGPPVVADLEPLRFFYSGVSAIDHDAACLAFYRVLEFYAFLAQTDEIARLRRDRTISDTAFVQDAVQLLSREEKPPLFRLLAKITSRDILVTAQKGGLVGEAKQAAFNEAVYAYRNSIVHGKFGPTFTLHSTPILQPDEHGAPWREVLKALAQTALQTVGAHA